VNRLGAIYLREARASSLFRELMKTAMIEGSPKMKAHASNRWRLSLADTISCDGFTSFPAKGSLQLFLHSNTSRGVW
jgi:hypothetical protein